jgi:ankyrin repeat protein
MHDGQTALQAAAGAGNIAVVQLLLSHGADPNESCEFFSWTALESAAHNDDVEITQLLISRGAIDIVSALDVAGKSHSNRVVHHLVRSRMRSHATLDDAFGRVAVRAATRCGDSEFVQRILSCGVDANAPANDGDTNWLPALQIAAFRGDIKLVETLVDHWADVNAPAAFYDDAEMDSFLFPGFFCATALQAAVSANQVQLVQLLLRHGALVNTCCSTTTAGDTALVAAARQHNLETFQLLLDFGADINSQWAGAVAAAVAPTTSPDSSYDAIDDIYRDRRALLQFLRFLFETWMLASNGDLIWGLPFGDPALVRAVRTGVGPTVTRLLLDHKAPGKSQALREATWNLSVSTTDVEDLEIAELLLASGADVGHFDSRCNGVYQDGDVDVFPWPRTALQHAANTDHPDFLRRMLAHRTTGYERAQALQSAVSMGNLDAVRLLLSHETDVNAAPLAYLRDAPRTALQAAAGKGDLRMVQYLLDAGADVDSKVQSSRERGTALHFSAMAGSMSVVTLLIQKGADVNAPAIGKDGRTALEGAAEHGRLDIVQLLLNLGAEVAGSRAIQFAREEGHDGVVALLEEA